MLDAVREIGDIILKKYSLDSIEILLEDPNSRGNYKNIFCITFEEREGKLIYIGIEREEYDSSKKAKYLYRSGPKNGSNFSPSAKVTKINKTFDGKILDWFKNVLSQKALNLTLKEKDFLKQLYEELSSNAKEIKEEFNRLIKEIPKKEGKIFLTLKFRSDNSVEYLGDKELFLEIFMKLLQIKEGKKITSKGQCSICLEEKEVTVGDGIYTFFTIDKPGYITGGFREKEAWKNFPICESCRRSLEKGKEYIERELTFKMAGISYQLIPKFIIGREFVKEDILDVLFDSPKLLSIKNSTSKRYLGDEEDILEYLSQVEDYLTLNFLFIDRKQSAEKILALIDDVLPSRLRNIFMAKEKVDKIFDEKEFTMKNLWTFFSKSDPDKREFDLLNYFLDIVDRIFKAKTIDKSFLFQLFMRKIRTQFARDEYFEEVVEDAIKSILFLINLNLIDMEVRNMEERLFDPFFKKFYPAFEHPLKKGLFLLGALTKALINVQFSKRESDPFRKQLKGLRMEEKDFKGLLPKVINKLQEYEAFDKGKQKLAEEISYYLLISGDKWLFSNDELNFYFVCGMNLYDEIASYIYQ